jgi:hypothetical protein
MLSPVLDQYCWCVDLITIGEFLLSLLTLFFFFFNCLIYLLLSFKVNWARMRDLFRKDLSEFLYHIPWCSSRQQFLRINYFFNTWRSWGSCKCSISQKVNSFQTGEPYEVVGCWWSSKLQHATVSQGIFALLNVCIFLMCCNGLKLVIIVKCNYYSPIL